MKDDRIQVRIEPALKEWLRVYATRKRQDMSAVIHACLVRLRSRDKDSQDAR